MTSAGDSCNLAMFYNISEFLISSRKNDRLSMCGVRTGRAEGKHKGKKLKI